MLMKILRKDILRKKTISLALFTFMLLSALLVASGSNMIVELMNSLNALFTKSSAPHFVQMHSGEFEREKIEEFSARNSLVKKKQIVEMVNIDGSNIDLGSDYVANNSIMDHYFVQQNDNFDFLLNLESQIIQVAKGEIAVPIYFMQQENMKIGDKVRISKQEFIMEFKVVDFVRDVQMNPSIIHSKRFVVNEADLGMLRKNVGEIEYLIEFQLTDLSKVNEFRNAYQAANLPNKSPDIDYNLFKTLNALTDGIVAAVIILVSILLSIIAILCIRFTILAAIEEDYREIGVMKAIGIGQRDIKKIYLVKYVVMVALASVMGYAASLFLNHLFTSNIMLYIGIAPKNILLHFAPFVVVIFIFSIVLLFCMLTLRKFNKITVVEALRSRNIGGKQRSQNYLTLNKSKFFNVQIYLGLSDVLTRFKRYRLLFFVFFICSFIIIVPVNFLNTVKSSDFIKYMGVEQSDLRIDLQESDAKEFNTIIAYLKADKDVARFSPLTTSQFKVINRDGVKENITIETGDFSIFPLEYVKGSAPVQDNEIALSYLNSKDLEKSVGDILKLITDGKEKTVVVSGIYQDVTNGGRTAKALLPVNEENVVRYEVSIDVKSDKNIREKMDEYAKAFYPVKVTDLEGYLVQTFGKTIDQLELLTIFTIVISVFLSILITSLFFKMLIAKDNAQISIMKSIGISLNDIRMQYVTSAFVVLMLAIILGTFLANTVGERIVSALLSYMGASEIKFVVDPIQAYIFCPLLLMLVVAITTLLNIVTIKKSSIAEMNAE